MANTRRDVTPTARKQFLALLDNPTRLGELLRTLHELGVLEKLIPQFAHARSLLQFNEYHKFTVDEHTLRAVENATMFIDRQDALGEAYRDLQDKWLLHLALLMHDLGKGFVEDHSELGAKMCLEIAPLFELNEHDTEVLRFLVHKHLTMSHLAFRRDTSDPQVILKFAREVGSPEVLSMLYVLTCADLSAVGPGVFNDWKAEVLSMLYQRTLRHLTGDSDADDVVSCVRNYMALTFNPNMPIGIAVRFKRCLPVICTAHRLISCKMNCGISRAWNQVRSRSGIVTCPRVVRRNL